MSETVTLWRPTGQKELDLVKQSGWKKWPPRLPEQPIFYPVLNRAYATRITREWNVPEQGVGFVTRFDVRKSFLDRYPVKKVGGEGILEYWIPAEDLEDLNANLVDGIRMVAEYRGPVPNAEIEQAEATLSGRLPEAWKQYLRQASWFRLGFPSNEGYLHLYTPSETIDCSMPWRNSVGANESSCILGSDGGGSYLVIDLRSASHPVVSISNIGDGWPEAREQARSVAEFLARIENGTFEFTV